jgi:NADPH2:quinone reductase
MKAFQAQSLSSLEDYDFIDAPKPEAKAGEIRVAIKACGVGHVDALVAVGKYPAKPRVPHIPGIEIAGVVDAVGAGVNALAVGDRVLALGVGGGGFAEYAVVPAAMTAKLPGGVSFVEAAALRVTYMTALYALRELAKLKTGETLLVIGCGSAVGIAAVQTGKLMGANVIAVAGTEEKRAFAKACGADHVLDNEPEGFEDRLAQIGGTVDVVFDPVGRRLFEQSYRSLSVQGRHLVVGSENEVGAVAPVEFTRGKATLMRVGMRMFMMQRTAEYMGLLRELLMMVDERKIVPVIDRKFPLDEAREALAFVLSGEVAGKTVLEIA